MTSTVKYCTHMQVFKKNAVPVKNCKSLTKVLACSKQSIILSFFKTLNEYKAIQRKTTPHSQNYVIFDPWHIPHCGLKTSRVSAVWTQLPGTWQVNSQNPLVWDTYQQNPTRTQVHTFCIHTQAISCRNSNLPTCCLFSHQFC